MSFRHRMAFVWVLLYAVCALGGSRSAHAQQRTPAGTRYVNLVNTRFATVSSGPQSSLIVDAAPDATREQIAAAVQRGVQAEWKARGSAISHQVDVLRRQGILKGRSVLPISTLVTVRQNGRLILPEMHQNGRAVGGGTLTFRYTGFSATDKAFLQQFVTLVYPLIVNLYGQPAVSSEVEVVNAGPRDGGTQTDVQRYAYGSYDVSNNRIILPTYASPDSFAAAFLLNIIHAFHGPAVLAYDSWEQGMARAAASIIARNPGIGFTDPTANQNYSLLKFYDVLNEPALGNSTFFPPSQANLNLDGASGVAKMLAARIGMSGAVFLKMYIENQAVFRQFNAAYYAQFTPGATPSLAGNVPALRGILAGILPTVEGIAFNSWFSQQYILDTSVSVGNKLYAFVAPSEYDATNGQSASITLVYYNTLGNGDEILLNDRAYATYFDSTDARLNLGTSSEQAVITDGEGFITTLAFPTPGFDAGRITADLHVGKETARTYLPNGFQGDFQGVVLGALTGDVAIVQTTVGAVNIRNKSTTLARGGFGATLGSDPNDLAVTAVTLTVNGVKTTYRFNTGEGQYYAIVRAGEGDVKTFTRSFITGQFPYLVSLPARPLATSTDAALGIPATDFILSYWDSSRTTYESFAPGSGIAPLQAGRGYWMKLEPLNGANQEVITVTGVAPPSDTDVTISTPFGWNLIGYPFLSTTPITKVLVQYQQNDAISWNDAVTKNLVAALPFGYTRGTGYGTSDTLDGNNWQGYWVRVLVPGGVSLILPGPNSPTSRAVSRATTPAPTPDWSVRLRAQGENDPQIATARLGAAAGVSRAYDNRFDLESPPAIMPGISLFFPHTDWGNAAGRYVADFRPSQAAGSETWEMRVATPKAGRVLLSWEGIGTLPRNTRLTLLDKTTGIRTALRSRSSYVYVAGSGDVSGRSFQIIAEPNHSQPFTMTDLTVTATRAAGTAISYSLTDQAQVTAEISTYSGKTISNIVTGRAQSAGRQTLHWNGRSQSGSPLPSGAYLLKLTARGEDGAQVARQMPVIVVQ